MSPCEAFLPAFGAELDNLGSTGGRIRTWKARKWHEQMYDQHKYQKHCMHSSVHLNQTCSCVAPVSPVIGLLLTEQTQLEHLQQQRRWVFLIVELMLTRHVYYEERCWCFETADGA